MDQGKGGADSGTPNGNENFDFTWSISYNAVLVQTKIKIIQKTIAKCLKVSISCKGLLVSSLLDSDSEMTLFYQLYFEKHTKPVVSPSSSEKGEAYSLFQLTTDYNGQLPMSMYLEMDVNVWGWRCWIWDFKDQRP